jgi:hypothetical protein
MSWTHHRCRQPMSGPAAKTHRPAESSTTGIGPPDGQLETEQCRESGETDGGMGHRRRDGPARRALSWNPGRGDFDPSGQMTSNGRTVLEPATQPPLAGAATTAPSPVDVLGAPTDCVPPRQAASEDGIGSSWRAAAGGGHGKRSHRPTRASAGVALTRRPRVRAAPPSGHISGSENSTDRPTRWPATSNTTCPAVQDTGTPHSCSPA